MKDELPRVLLELHAGDPSVRREAAARLGRIGDRRVIPVVATLLEDRDPGVRRAGADALGDLGGPEVIEPLARALRDAEPAVRWSAAYALGATRLPEAVPPLLDALHDPEGAVRTFAAAALGDLGDPRAVPALLRAMDAFAEPATAEVLVRFDLDARAVAPLGRALDRAVAARAAAEREGEEETPDPLSDPRLRVLDAFGRITDPAAIPALLPLLRSSDGWHRAAALAGLAAVGPEAAPPLLDLLDEPGVADVDAVLETLCLLGDPESFSALVLRLGTEEVARVLGRVLAPGLVVHGSAPERAMKALGWDLLEPFAGLLDHADPEVRRAAAPIFGHLGDRRAAPFLLASLEAADRAGKERALWALAAIADPAAVEVFAGALGTDLGRAATAGLGALGAEAAPALVAALREGPAPARGEAARLLGTLAPPGAFEPLAAAAGDADAGVRRSALWALGTLGDPRAVEPLVRALSDPPARLAAAQALVALGDGRALEPLRAAAGAAPPGMGRELLLRSVAALEGGDEPAGKC